LPDGTPCRKPTFNTQAGTFHTPYYEQWSAGIQQAVGDRTSLGLTYVGNHGVNIPIFNEGVNAIDPGYCGAGFDQTCFGNAFNASAPAAMFGTTQQYQIGAVSNYNGVTASFSQRMTYGFTVQASYTWSHTMDEISNGGTTLPYNGITSLQYLFNPNCIRCQYGNADYDIRSSFNASYVWQTPFKFGNKFVNGALGGWTISQNFFARTGLPYTLVDGFTAITNYGPVTPVLSVNGFAQSSCSNGFSQCVPNDTGNYNNPSSLYISPGYNAALNIPTNPIGTLTNQRRNQYRGPGFFDSDFTINKNFKLTERLAFGFGANFYNIFNHPNFTNPDQTFGDSTFGQILQTTAPPTGPYGSFFSGLPSGRIIQFQGKLVF